jgi:hypothetical protein
MEPAGIEPATSCLQSGQHIAAVFAYLQSFLGLTDPLLVPPRLPDLRFFLVSFGPRWWLGLFPTASRNSTSESLYEPPEAGLSGDVVRAARGASTARIGAGQAAQDSAQVNNAAWFVGTTSAGTRIDFRTSPSGAWVRDFHLVHSYPAAGLRQNGDGVFVGMLSSRLTDRGRPAGIRVHVSVLFLSPSEATGAGHVVSGAKAVRFASEKSCSSQETLPFRPELGTRRSIT